MEWLEQNAMIIGFIYLGGVIIALGHLIGRILPKEKPEDDNAMSGIASLFD